MTQVQKRALALSLALVLATGAAFAQFNTQMRRANKQYELFAFNLAIPSYEEALKRRPDDLEALSKIADAHRHLNQLAQAEEYYARAVRQRDVEKIHILNYGHVLKGLGKYEQAKQFYLLYARDADAQVGNHYAQSCDFARDLLTKEPAYSVVNEFINTSAADFAPAFRSGTQVAFASARTDIQRGSSNWAGVANNQLFVAAVGPNGYLEQPVFLRGVAKSPYNEGPLAFSPDGRLVAFTRNNFVDGTRQIPSSGMELSMQIAEVNANGDWVNVRPFPFNGSDFSSGYPAFSPDGMAIYFASNRPGGFGGFDIYISRWAGNDWGTPENLGPTVNTPGHEITPFHDGQSLYFASDWHFGLGGFDCFRADETDGRWASVAHAGLGVNSPADDYGFIFDLQRNTGYVASNRTGGRGAEDIYRLTRQADMVSITIKNASDGSPLPGAIVDFTNCGDGAYRADDSGIYRFQAPPGVNCNVIVRREGFQNAIVQVAAAGAQASNNYEVALVRLGEAYAGRIVDAASRQPIPDVTVVATNQQSGQAITTQTNANGEYYLGLNAFNIYALRYSRPGFQDVNLTARTEDGFDRTILGVVSMTPTTGLGGLPGPVEPGTPGSTAPQVQRGFAVQVAAVNTLNLQPFERLSNVGTVYAKQDGSRHRVRVGVFNTRQEAETALRTIRRTHPDAFIVAEDGAEVGTQPDMTPRDPATPGTAAAPGLYRVQIGAFSKPNLFDSNGLDRSDTITDEVRGKVTVKHLAGFNTLAEAQAALQRARAAGFTDAFILVNEQGRWNRVR